MGVQVIPLLVYVASQNRIAEIYTGTLYESNFLFNRYLGSSLIVVVILKFSNLVK